MMGDETGNKGIPSWQKPSSASSTSKDDNPASSAEPDQPTSQSQEKSTEQLPVSDSIPSTESLVKQARRFLDDESLKDAPLEEKIAFLQAKGLSNSDIEQTVQQSKNADSASKSTTAAAIVKPEHLEYRNTDTQSGGDVPPIITYPEFLMQAQKPPPLITATRLLNTAYAAAGVGAIIYGISKYLVAPMTDSLTSSRHDFAMYVQEQLDQLNSKLAEVVSTDTIPGSTAHRNLPFSSSGSTANDAASEADSSNSDPTELFHRDFGTQTSPGIVSSSTSSSSTDEPPETTTTNPVQDQTNWLTEISNGLTELRYDDTEDVGSAAELTQSLKILDNYLDSLAFPSYPSAHDLNPYGLGYGADNDKSKKQDDEIQRMKAEIRSVKGVLLSARNFPGSTGTRRALYPPTT